MHSTCTPSPCTISLLNHTISGLQHHLPQLHCCSAYSTAPNTVQCRRSHAPLIQNCTQWGLIPLFLAFWCTIMPIQSIAPPQSKRRNNHSYTFWLATHLCLAPHMAQPHSLCTPQCNTRPTTGVFPLTVPDLPHLHTMSHTQHNHSIHSLIRLWVLQYNHGVNTSPPFKTPSYSMHAPLHHTWLSGR